MRSVHQQDDGTICAICATGTSTKDSLLSWIRLLEANGNPVLSQIIHCKRSLCVWCVYCC
uniref:ECSIT C-terminal domain-containing protein n=1 Tax=Glossina morsitans morsitans TaxID=37546 RepID=A0A905AUS3_GLOMM